MVGRPALPVGIHGNVSTRQIRTKCFEAQCYVRDVDGQRREVARRGASRSEAKTNLIKALGDRPAFGGGDITAEVTLGAVAEAYFEQLDRAVKDGKRSYNTFRSYRSVWDTEISPAVGKLRVREATTSRLDAYLVSTRDRLKTDHRLAVKTVLTNVLTLAVRRGALTVNPMRETEGISRTEQKEVRSLSVEQVTIWLKHLATDPVAVKYSLLDFSLLMLATGARISEVLAILIEDVNLTTGSVVLDYRITRVGGEGLQRVRRRGKKGAGTTLHLPSWAVEAVARRIVILDEETGPLFPGISVRWRDPRQIRDAIASVRTAAGSGDLDFLTSHTFRKTVATLLDNAGVDVRDIAAHLTHSSERTTERFYIERKATGAQTALALEFLGENLPGRPSDK